MLRHKKCRTKVLAQICQRFLGDVGIGREGITAYNLTSISSREVSYYCESCETTVETEELETNCLHCGEIYSVDNLYVLLTGGGYYCESCSNMVFSNDPRVKMNTVIKTLALQRRRE